MAGNFDLIQNTISRYTNAVNRRNWPVLGEVFAQEAVWEVPALPDARFVGRDQIIVRIPALVHDTDTLTQLNTPSVITIDGDKAKAECSIRETGFIKGNTRFEAHGIYEDELILRDGVWVFVYRRFVMLENFIQTIQK